MKVVHISNYYHPEIMYQHTAMPLAHSRLGHEVYVITSNVNWPGRTVKSVTGDPRYKYDDTQRIHLYRLPSRVHYKKHSLPIITGVFRMLSQLEPEMIFVQGISNPSIVMPAINYIKHNPGTKLNIFSHMSGKNSSLRSRPLSRLYHNFWRLYYRKNLRFVNRFLPTGIEEYHSLIEVYGSRIEDERKAEILPLGGWIADPEVVLSNRRKWRSKLGISMDDFVFVHSSRVQRRKLVVESLEEFRKICHDKSKFIVIGPVEEEDLLNELLKLSGSELRIQIVNKLFTSKELAEISSIGDVGVYFGSQTIAARELLCLGIPLVVGKADNWEHVVREGAAVMVDSPIELRRTFERFMGDSTFFERMRHNANKYSREFLDWVKLAERSLNI